MLPSDLSTDLLAAGTTCLSGNLNDLTLAGLMAFRVPRDRTYVKDKSASLPHWLAAAAAAPFQAAVAWSHSLSWV